MDAPAKIIRTLRSSAATESWFQWIIIEALFSGLCLRQLLLFFCIKDICIKSWCCNIKLKSLCLLRVTIIILLMALHRSMNKKTAISFLFRLTPLSALNSRIWPMIWIWQGRWKCIQIKPLSEPRRNANKKDKKKTRKVLKCKQTK